MIKGNHKRLRSLYPRCGSMAGALASALETLWSLRVLENWAVKHECPVPSPEHEDSIYAPGARWRIRLTPGSDPKFGASADHARYVLAVGLAEEDPKLNPWVTT